MAAETQEKPQLVVRAVNESGVIRLYRGDGKATMRDKTPRSYLNDFMNVFLPAGYPYTVTPDYTPYQIYDSLQAFSSTIAGLLSSRAVLQGFGVGDSASSATAAVLLTVLQESTGRLATILFAHHNGRAIAPECKFYRFLADIVNDSALLLDVLSPALPPYPKVLVLCTAGVLRALCGVSGGAAKAALSAHFAKTGNLAELNAKDGSQETVISLFGMLVGSLFVQLVHDKAAVWFWMVVLVGVHLWTNYQAVRAVQMRTLNKQRLSIILNELDNGILRPNQVAAKENILTWKAPNVSFVDEFPPHAAIDQIDFKEFADAKYTLYYRSDIRRADIMLKTDASTRVVLEAWTKAYYIVRTGRDPYSDALKEEEWFDTFWKRLESAGWDLETNALETGPSIRFDIAETKED